MKKRITIIIPVREGEDYNETLTAVRASKYDLRKVELFLVFGNNPSEQRNIAAEKASGDILYFLDNDSKIGKNNLKIIDDFFKQYKDAGGIGGPSLTPDSDTLFQKSIGIVFGSFIGSSFSYSRYSKTGRFRESDEKELILCNLAFNRDIFMAAGMFNKNLYPNEENELLNKLKAKGIKVFYNPDLFVFRSQRDNWKSFIKQVFTYGRGRAEQVLVNIRNMTLFPVVSLFFDIYLITFLIFFHNYKITVIPFLFYIFIIFWASLYYSVKKHKVSFLKFVPVQFFLVHTVYGIGFIWGLVKSLFGKKREQAFKYKIKKISFDK